MREIKFKAKRTDNDEWVYGNLYIHNIHNILKTCFIISDYAKGDPLFTKNTEFCIGCLIKVDPDTVCQFTGKRDKKGKDAYENDTIESKGRTGSIWYNDNACSFKIDTAGGLILDIYLLHECEIIGNKFDKGKL